MAGRAGQWHFSWAVAVIAGVWTAGGMVIGGISPALYPRGEETLRESLYVGAMGGLLAGLAWCVHMIRRSMRRGRGEWGATVASGAWTGLGVAIFYGLLLQGGIAVLTRTSPTAALAHAALAVGVLGGPAGFLLGLLLGLLWAGLENLFPPQRPVPSGPVAPRVGPSYAPPAAPGPYDHLLTPAEPSAFDHDIDLDHAFEPADDPPEDRPLDPPTDPSADLPFDAPPDAPFDPPPKPDSEGSP